MTTINKQEQTYRQPSTGTIIKGIATGFLVQNLVLLPHLIGAPKIMEKMNDICQISKDEHCAVDKAIEETLKISGLIQKGVKIIKANKNNTSETTKILTEAINTDIPMRYMPDFVKNLYARMYQELLNKGMNAFYSPLHKKVVTPEKRLSLVPFHEMGHAVNHNFKGVFNQLRKTRIIKKLILPISLVGYLKNKKALGEEPKSKTDKTTTFIKNNAGKLTFIALIPMLIEEAAASIKGNAFARKTLNPKLAQKVAKTNGLAYLTYLGYLILVPASIAIGIKVKDSIARPKKIKIKKHQQAVQQ